MKRRIKALKKVIGGYIDLYKDQIPGIILVVITLTGYIAGGCLGYSLYKPIEPTQNEIKECIEIAEKIRQNEIGYISLLEEIEEKGYSIEGNSHSKITISFLDARKGSVTLKFQENGIKEEVNMDDANDRCLRYMIYYSVGCGFAGFFTYGVFNLIIPPICKKIFEFIKGFRDEYKKNIETIELEEQESIATEKNE